MRYGEKSEVFLAGEISGGLFSMMHAKIGWYPIRHGFVSIGYGRYTRASEGGSHPTQFGWRSAIIPEFGIHLKKFIVKFGWILYQEDEDYEYFSRQTLSQFRSSQQTPNNTFFSFGFYL